MRHLFIALVHSSRIRIDRAGRIASATACKAGPRPFGDALGPVALGRLQQTRDPLVELRRVPAQRTQVATGVGQPVFVVRDIVVLFDQPFEDRFRTLECLSRLFRLGFSQQVATRVVAVAVQIPKTSRPRRSTSWSARQFRESSGDRTEPLI